jgi:hypothetical protein
LRSFRRIGFSRFLPKSDFLTISLPKSDPGRHQVA